MQLNLAWLFLFGAAAAADISTTTVRMRSEAVCSEAVANSSAIIAAAPTGTPTELRELSGVSDARVCSVACAVWPQCAIASYRPGNRTCLLGNLGAWQPCKIEPLTLLRAPTPPKSLLTRLLGLYSFRFGLDNLVAAVAPGAALPAASATPTANFVYGRGVKLPGDYNAYLEVNLTGLGGRPFSSSGRTTFYARFVPDFSTPASSMGVTVHTIYNSSFLPSDVFSHTSKWSLDAILGGISFEAHDLAPLVYGFSSSFNPTLPAGTTHSFAVVFDPTNGARLVHNGTWSATTISTAASVTARGEEMLRIGYDPVKPFAGMLLCYAVAADNLTLSELQQLDQVC